ncbi:YqhA family protein [Deinococcus peraridilitoris]|uniref:Putative membrane protein n=1 Tax=Deinococcus peraridilitoris (strain DSM 19664 / LMG 22246 / CIP 109416 / KR-200) TaxID=937777 RepID=L0A5L4_DEIPD|nr:YqhA family protein [Deinococcus peraridilitoris]AFZ69131.1 putative membrane protein [Deinococcus peraridilitoris DSM 19664]
MANSSTHDRSGKPPTPFSRAVGQSRFIVLLAVIAVMLVAVSLFLLGTVQAAYSVWSAWSEVVGGKLNSTDLTVEFLEIVSVMLKAVVFYIIGVGLYSLFIAPLNLTVSLGVETLNDLESKVVSVVIVIMSITFLEHFIRWTEPIETLQFGVAFAVVVAALVFFQRYSHRAKEDQQAHHPDVQERAKKELFQEDHEEHMIRPEDIEGRGPSVQHDEER